MRPIFALLLPALLGAGSALPALAQGVTLDQLVYALKPPVTQSVQVVERKSAMLEQKIGAANPDEVFEEIKSSELPTVDITVNFAFDSFALSAPSQASLDLLAQAITDPRLADYRFVIGGHTDSKGTEEYNDGLSIQRAEAAVQHLMFRGVDPARLVVTGFGERYLKNTADGEAAENRRVQIVTIK